MYQPSYGQQPAYEDLAPPGMSEPYDPYGRGVQQQAPGAQAPSWSSQPSYSPSFSEFPPGAAPPPGYTSLSNPASAEVYYQGGGAPGGYGMAGHGMYQQPSAPLYTPTNPSQQPQYPPNTQSRPEYTAVDARAPVPTPVPALRFNSQSSSTTFLPASYPKTTVPAPVPTSAVATVPAPALSTGASPFPPAMKEYMSRAFSVCPADRKDELNDQLRSFCRQLAASNEIQTTDWANLALPPICYGKKTKKGKKSKAYGEVTNISPSLTKKGKKQKNQMGSLGGSTFEEEARREQRARRFEASGSSPYPNPSLASGSRTGSPGEGEGGIVVGLCEDIEKNYYRLTSAPVPTAVRPPRILARTLQHLLERATTPGVSYPWLCDQYKSMRQDLTVQHIRDEFTARVYETHGRLALSHGDLGEFNQCQTQLRALYSLGIPGCEGEFTGYMLLYVIYTQNAAGLIATLAALRDDLRGDPGVKHALAVRSAVGRGDWLALRRLRGEALGMGGHLMDKFADRENVRAMAVMSRAYRAPIPLERLSTQLTGLLEGDGMGTRDFLLDHGAGQWVKTERVPAPSGGKRVVKRSFELYPSRDLWAAARGKFTRVDIKGQV